MRDNGSWTGDPMLPATLGAVALALAIRLPLVAPADFPLADGGLFFTMASDLAANGFHLPVFTSYGGGHIPFAYPPLGFYLAAALSAVSGWQLLGVVQWLPLLVNVGTVAAFPLLAGRVLGSRRSVVLATLVFPCFPYSYQWLIMGGGVTRAFGMLFLVLAVAAVLELVRRPGWWTFASAALATGGAVLSHPELGLVTVLTVPLAAAAGRTGSSLRRRLMLAVATIAGAALVASPWWISVVARHGLTPFLNAATSTPAAGMDVLVNLAIFPFTAEPLLHVLAVLGVLGLLRLALTGRPLVPIWFLLMLVAVPRNAATPMTLPLALAVGVCLDEQLIGTWNGSRREVARRWASLAAPVLLAGWVLGYAYVENRFVLRSSDLVLPVLDDAQREVMAWVHSHTPEDARFLVITAPVAGGRDPVVEWFPALAGRESVLTPQGREWLGDFSRRANLDGRLKSCLGEGLPCLEKLTAELPPFSHVLVARGRYGAGLGRLRAELAASPRFRTLHDGSGGTVFATTALWAGTPQGSSGPRALRPVGAGGHTADPVRGGREVAAAPR